VRFKTITWKALTQVLNSVCANNTADWIQWGYSRHRVHHVR